METRYLPYASLFLRLVLGFTLLAAVADRIGIFGEPGAAKAIWGDWDTYVDYLQVPLPFLSEDIVSKIALVITLLQFSLAVMLIFGLKVRWAAVGTGLLTLVSAFAGIIFMETKAVADLAAFITPAASFLLACTPIYRWTWHGVKKRSTYNPY